MCLSSSANASTIREKGNEGGSDEGRSPPRGRREGGKSGRREGGILWTVDIPTAACCRFLARRRAIARTAVPGLHRRNGPECASGGGRGGRGGEGGGNVKKMVLRLSAALRRRFAHALTDAYLDTQVWSGQVWRRREGGYDERDGYVSGMRIPGPENQKAKRGWIQCAKFEV